MMTQQQLAAVSDEPATVDEAFGKEWHSAMMEELTLIKESGTWSLMDLPRGHHPIGLNWVFKLKLV
jgi:hypothetical protein